MFLLLSFPSIENFILFFFRLMWRCWSYTARQTRLLPLSVIKFFGIFHFPFESNPNPRGICCPVKCSIKACDLCFSHVWCQLGGPLKNVHKYMINKRKDIRVGKLQCGWRQLTNSLLDLTCKKFCSDMKNLSLWREKLYSHSFLIEIISFLSKCGRNTPHRFTSVDMVRLRI